MDAKPWSICLSFARRCKSNTYTNGVPECYSYGNSNDNGDTDAETYPLTEGYTDAEAASYAAAATIAHS